MALSGPRPSADPQLVWCLPDPTGKSGCPSHLAQGLTHVLGNAVTDWLLPLLGAALPDSRFPRPIARLLSAKVRSQPSELLGEGERAELVTTGIDFHLELLEEVCIYGEADAHGRILPRRSAREEVIDE